MIITIFCIVLEEITPWKEDLLFDEFVIGMKL